jgi:hypothetical protein
MPKTEAYTYYLLLTTYYLLLTTYYLLLTSLAHEDEHAEDGGVDLLLTTYYLLRTTH